MRDDTDPADAGPDDVPGRNGVDDGSDEVSWADALAQSLEGEHAEADDRHDRVPAGDEDLADSAPIPVMEAVPAPAPANIPELNPFGLTEQELRFAHAYAVWENGAKAAEFAGYGGGSSQASKLLQDSRIRGEVARAQGKQMRFRSDAPVNPTPGELLQLMHDIAFADPLGLVVEDPETGKAKWARLKDIPQKLRHAIKSVSIDKNGQVQVQLMDRWNAITQLGRYHGIGTKMLPGDATPITEEQPVDETPAPEPVKQIPATLENVVKLHAQRIASGVLGGKSS